MPPKRTPRKRETKPAIKPPIPLSAKAKAEIESEIHDNTEKEVKRKPTEYAERHSKFLITFNPNSSVNEEINPELFKKLKAEIKSFASYVLDPANMKYVLKSTTDDPDFIKKVIRYEKDKTASIEYKGAANKRLHTHIYLDVAHKTKLQVDVANLREIAAIMLKPLGIEGAHIDVKVESSRNTYSARDYVLKMGELF